MSSAYAPIKGKCTWWRERPVEEDIWDMRLKEAERRVHCSCFVEGTFWAVSRAEIPEDCPDKRRCRYYIHHS